MPSTIDLEKFSIPLDAVDPLGLVDGDENVIVVAIIGKGRHHVNHSKASLTNLVIGSDVFMGSLQDENQNQDGSSNSFRIEGYYDQRERVIYLHLLSVYDASIMVNLCRQASQTISNKGPYPFWQDAEFMHARALLYLFSVSHILVLVHPGSTFDVTYVRFFRTLDTIRQKLLPPLTDVLRGTSVSRDWMLAGRPCSPRVLFVFESSSLDTGAWESDSTGPSKGRSQKTPPIKRLQHSIEDQVYRVLRKARIITNISNNSLFAVPANQEFVYVHSQMYETRDIIGYYLGQLKNSCDASKETDAPRSRSYQTNRHADRSHRSQASYSNETKYSSAPSARGSNSSYSNSFKDFLRQHIELAQTKGFDDNVGRNPLPAVFEVPTLSSWISVSSTLYDFFIVDHADTKMRPHFNTLKSLLEVGLRFSEGRCAKVLPIAEGVYQEGLPPHYTKAYHIQALMSAKRKFMQHARGLAADKYLQQLAEGCEKFWRSGRQLCEETSLNGNHCVNPLHVISEFDLTPETQALPVMHHSSQVRTKMACNCGRTQAEKEDPFDHKAANYDFYDRLNQQCCGKLESISIPVFEPSTAEVKAAVTSGSRSPSEGPLLPSSSNTGTLATTPSRQPAARKDSARLEIGQAMSNLSLALSLDQSSRSSNRSNESDLSDSASVSSGQSAGSDLFVNDGPDSSYNPEADNIASQVSQDQQALPMETHTTEPTTTTAVLVRQHSTTEYLPGMLHSKCPPGLLPKFPSWSLVSVGKFSTYSPTQGLDQPGFLHSSNYLLPYDVIVTADREKWPVLGDSKKGKARKIHKDSGETSVRIYLGNEYECPRGHRFFCSNPEKIFKAPPGGMTKETAHKIITSDMPLYFPCHCRSSKGYIAQLMRVFVAVPEGPINVKLKPMVQPAPTGCPLFHPGNTSPITLQNGLIWVLRLPHFYKGDHVVYRIPADPQQVSACRVLRGLYQIVDDTQT